MAMAVASSGGGGRRRGRRGRKRPLADINVTPMVDVMLVLLIVFMVAAPLLTVGVPIDLPKTAAKELNTDSKPITVSITPDGAITLDPGGKTVTLDTLIDEIQAVSTADSDQRIYVRGDQTANYGAVMKVMGKLSAAGFSKIGLITAQEQVQ
jgi:biopolymer transport protein TolR